jgi:hypothetical protein
MRRVGQPRSPACRVQRVMYGQGLLSTGRPDTCSLALPAAELLYGAKTGKFQYDNVLNLSSKTADGVVSAQRPAGGQGDSQTLQRVPSSKPIPPLASLAPRAWSSAEQWEPPPAWVCDRAASRQAAAPQRQSPLRATLSVGPVGVSEGPSALTPRAFLQQQQGCAQSRVLAGHMGC